MKPWLLRHLEPHPNQLLVRRRINNHGPHFNTAGLPMLWHTCGRAVSVVTADP